MPATWGEGGVTVTSYKVMFEHFKVYRLVLGGSSPLPLTTFNGYEINRKIYNSHCVQWKNVS